MPGKSEGFVASLNLCICISLQTVIASSFEIHVRQFMKGDGKITSSLFVTATSKKNFVRQFYRSQKKVASLSSIKPLSKSSPGITWSTSQVESPEFPRR